MSFQFTQLAQAISADGEVTSEELLSLRQMGWGDGKISHGEAEAIFAINNVLEDPGPEWADFFVEALGEFVLNGSAPRNFVDEAKARWLIDSLDKDGRLESCCELELIIRVLERATNVSALLQTYVMQQVEAAVLTGSGPTRKGGDLCEERITADECNMLRRTIFASGGDAPAAVSRSEAEALFRLKDATLGHDNAPEWKQLFVDGVSNYLCGFTHQNAQLSAARINELEGFVSDNSANVGRFFGRMASSAPSVHNHFGNVFGRAKDANTTDYDANAAKGEEITASEQSWLDAQIGADGQVDALEQALLRNLAEELA